MQWLRSAAHVFLRWSHPPRAIELSSWKSFGLWEERNVVIKRETVSKSPNYPLTCWTRNPWVISSPFKGEPNKLKPNNNLKSKTKANRLELEQEFNVGFFFFICFLCGGQNKNHFKKHSEVNKVGNAAITNQTLGGQSRIITWKDKFVCQMGRSECNETSIVREELMHH